MPKSKEEIMREIKEYIERCGGGYSEWYVGISKDARKRLFVDHNVNEKEDYSISIPVGSTQVARIVEHYFVSFLGTDGGPGGGDEDADMVYAYKKQPHTDP